MNIKTCKYNKKRFCSLGLICWQVEGRKQGVAPVPGDLKAQVPRSWPCGAQERAARRRRGLRAGTPCHRAPQRREEHWDLGGFGGCRGDWGLASQLEEKAQPGARPETGVPPGKPTVSSSSSTSQPCDRGPDGTLTEPRFLSCKLRSLREPTFHVVAR